VTQSVPAEVPKARLPAPSEACEMAPQVSEMRTNWPASVELVAVVKL